MDTDPSGNVYALGYFTGTVDFDPGPATYTLSTPTLTQPEIFLCKLDANGSLLWARHFTGNYAGYGTSLAYSPAGDIYMTGFFRGMLDADPGVGVQNYSSNDHSLFIIQLDISGNFVMGNHFQSAGGNFPVMFGWSIDVDASGNVYTAGNFVGTADFDPGIGTCMLTAGNASSGDVFVLKLNAAGNFVWAKQFTGEYPRGITIHANNVYVTGMFAGTTDFDPGPGVYTITATGPGTPAGNHKNQFLVKFDLSGNFVWAAHIGSTLFSHGVGLAIDALSNIYCTGYFEGPADFDPGQGAYTLQSNGGLDAFLLKLDANGHFVWAKTFGGTSNDIAASVALNQYADIYMTGNFEATCDFDPGSGVANLTSAGRSDAFLLKWGQCSGFAPLDITPVQNKTLCNTAVTSLSVIANNPVGWYTSPNGTISVATGSVYTTTTLAPGTYTYYAADLLCKGTRRAEIVLSVNDCTGLKAYTNETGITLYPVPTTDGWVTVITGVAAKAGVLKVYDVLGKLILEQQIDAPVSALDLSTQPAGLYIVRLMDNGRLMATQKIVRQ